MSGNWRKWMRAFRPFGRQQCRDSSAALVAAGESHRQAVTDLGEAIRLRVQSEEAASAVRAHNTANRYDDFLRRVVHGSD